MRIEKTVFTITRRRILGATASFTAFAAMGLPSRANEDAALYDPAPPADSAYLRVIALNAEKERSVTVGPARFDVAAEAAVTPYKVLSAGEWPVAAGGEPSDVSLDVGGSYSLALGLDGAATLIKDEIVEDPAKCGLMLYNLTGGAARLYVPVKDIDIVPEQPPGGHKTRAVNAITVDLAVAVDGAEIARFDEVKLRRRSHFSFIVGSSEGAMEAMMAENQIA